MWQAHYCRRYLSFTAHTPLAGMRGPISQVRKLRSKGSTLPMAVARKEQRWDVGIQI